MYISSSKLLLTGVRKIESKILYNVLNYDIIIQTNFSACKFYDKKPFVKIGS